MAAFHHIKNCMLLSMWRHGEYLSPFSCVAEGTHSLPGGDIQPCTDPDVAYAQNLFCLMHCVHTKQFLARCSMSTIYFTTDYTGSDSEVRAVLFNERIFITQQNIINLLGFQNY
jgi:hypothetical protein